MEAPTCTVGLHDDGSADSQASKQHGYFAEQDFYRKQIAFFCVIWVVDDGDCLRNTATLRTRKKTSRDPGDQCKSGRHVKECCPGNVINYPLIEIECIIARFSHADACQTDKDWREYPCAGYVASNGRFFERSTLLVGW